MIVPFQQKLLLTHGVPGQGRVTVLRFYVLDESDLTFDFFISFPLLSDLEESHILIGDRIGAFV